MTQQIFANMAGMTEAQLKLVAELEMEMMADMYNRQVVESDGVWGRGQVK